MSNVNKLMLKESYSLNGFQETNLAPVLLKNGTWITSDNGFRNQSAPSTNVHYNGNKYWVASFQYEDGDIYLLDIDLRKGNIHLNDSLKIQLAQIYGYGKSKLTVQVPFIQQQNNGHDCGLFAIANMMEFATNRYSGLKEGKLEFRFIQSKMREHLIKCFNQNFMEPFPKEKIKPKKIKVESIVIDLFCCCSIPDVKGIGPWIACYVCDQWYLQKCEGINGNEIPRNQQYICKKCSI